jgi:hypothetical protein
MADYNKYPNPWNFSNADKNLISPDGKYRIEFGELYEIAMGAPIGGTCYLILNDSKIELNTWSGGPVIWNGTSTKVALPIWTKNRNQKIAVVDVTTMTITIYKQEFRVLDLQRFDDNLIIGIDSPIYMTTYVKVDIDNEKTEVIKRLNH